jgi:hypothetical protein
LSGNRQGKAHVFISVQRANDAIGRRSPAGFACVTGRGRAAKRSEIPRGFWLLL